MGSPIVTMQQVIARGPVAVDAPAQVALAEIIQAATDAIEAQCNRVFVQQVFMQTYDGYRKPVGRNGDHLYLDNPPVAISPMPTVTENGIALTVTASYDAAGAFGVVLNPDDGFLIRTPSPWAWGNRNLVVTYTGGFPTVPGDIVSACVELTWLMWTTASKSGGWNGYTTGDVNAQLIRELSAASQAAIQRHTLWGRP